MVDGKNPLCEQRVNSSYQLRLVAHLLSEFTLQDVHSEGDSRLLWLRLAFDPRRRKPTFQIWRQATIVRLEIAERSIESEKWFAGGDARSIVSDGCSISGARRSVLVDWCFVNGDQSSQTDAESLRLVDFRSFEIASKD